MQNAPILVIGSTGKTGRRIVRLLESQSINIRHGSRSSSTPFDWDDQSTWAPALHGAKAVYISYFPDLAIPQAPTAIEELTILAKQAGVEKLVLLSGRGEINAQRCEQLVRDSGIAFTLVRASWFFENFSEGHLLESVRRGQLAFPAGDVREPFVSVDDIAEVAAVALTDDRHDGQLYEVTGPQLLSFADAASTLSESSGREVVYTSVTSEQFREGLTAEAGPELANLLTDLCDEVLDGRNESLGHGVQQALNREPRDFASYCSATSQNGNWA